MSAAQPGKVSGASNRKLLSAYKLDGTLWAITEAEKAKYAIGGK